tara:strand:- start:5431 stop:6117 length:687 start_codon:yes stop_codon:yes gene_type:complete
MKKDKVRGRIIRPFGPSIGKFQLPKHMLDELNHTCDLISADKMLSESLDHSERLVGKVRQELGIPREIISKYDKYFNQVVSDYLKQINRLPSSIESTRKTGQNIIPENSVIGTHIKSAWFVSSFAGDYNPVHMHPDAVISIAGFLKVPDWDKEQELDREDHYGLTHGCLTFLFGDLSALSNATYVIRPKVGDFYVFPGWLQHAVYPFRSEGERRSFSLNVITQIQKKN